jgi:predicted phosphodiesterase
MTILVISDIHANLTALEAVLSDAGKVDAVWCLGDLVGYGPDPNECISRVRLLPGLVCMRGNHDAAALGQIDIEAFNAEAKISIQWLLSRLTDESLEFLGGLPEKKVIGQITLAHGSPRNPVWEYILDTRTALRNFDYFETLFCFVGHTHLPIIYQLDDEEKNSASLIVSRPNDRFTLLKRALLNPGSVGQPRDHNPKASYALFDPIANTWENHRVAYDLRSVQTRILEAGLPTRHALRLEEGW